MSRPQAGAVYAISKLPGRKPSSDEKEAMNCKSCRKRKIKCSRTRPKCNSCEVFHCECLYDAVPRKRGPKTEVLEELLKRIDGLERRIEDGKSNANANNNNNASTSHREDVSRVDREVNDLEEDEDEDEVEQNVHTGDNNSNNNDHANVNDNSSHTINNNNAETVSHENSTAENYVNNEFDKPLVNSNYNNNNTTNYGNLENGNDRRSIEAISPRARRSSQALDLRRASDQASISNGSFVPDSGTNHNDQRGTHQDLSIDLTGSRFANIEQDTTFIPHLVDIFFQRIQGKPYSFMHEKTIRVRINDGTCPPHLLNAICALAVRYTLPPAGKTLAQCSEGFARLAKEQVDADEPSIDNLQTLMLLSNVYFALGLGKRSFMHLGTTIRMCLALELHRELPELIQSSPIQREIRRRCFWSCYLMDRFAVCGSNRPPLINDSTIRLRLPCSEHAFVHGIASEESFFSEGGFGQHFSTTPLSKNMNALCVEIVRILGKTVLYTQHGGVKGDSHFPWHSSSNLSMIRNELKLWAANLDGNVFDRTRFPNETEATTYFLCKGIYHLIHCLMYRTFLPIDLKELSGTGTQQAWQMEATNMCLQHANALTELASVASKTVSVEWPAFISYCLTSAATVLVHGIQYTSHVFSGSSRDNLLRIIRYLIKMRRQWAVINHQCSTIRRIYLNHIRLTKGYANDPKYLDDFFDRYDDAIFDTGFVPFRFLNDFTDETLSTPDDLFSDPTLADIFHSPVPSEATPQNALPSPSITGESTASSSLTLDEFMRPKQYKRRRVNRTNSSSSYGLPNPIASDLKQIRAQNRRHHSFQQPSSGRAQNHFRSDPHMVNTPQPSAYHHQSQFQPQLQHHQPQQSPPALSVIEDTMFQFSPNLPNSIYSDSSNQYAMSPSDSHSFFSSNPSNPYANLFDFDPSAALLSEDFILKDGKDAPNNETEPDPLMMLLSEMAQQEDTGITFGNGDIFMGSNDL